MVIHIAIFKFNPQHTKEQIDQAMKEVQDLKNKIPQIIEIFAGNNVSKYSQGFTHAIVVKFKSKEDLEAYRAHPDHKPIAEKLDQMEADSIGIDFET